jgi:hypothetical protein
MLFFLCLLAILTFILMGHYNVDTVDRKINILYRQSARYAVASMQDDSDIIRILHSNYAAGYLWAIKDIATTNEFKRATGEDLLEFEKKIVAIQDEATFKLITECKSLLPLEDPMLVRAMYSAPKSPEPNL